jgi:hypothetical protein
MQRFAPAPQGVYGIHSGLVQGMARLGATGQKVCVEEGAHSPRSAYMLSRLSSAIVGRVAWLAAQARHSADHCSAGSAVAFAPGAVPFSPFASC